MACYNLDKCNVLAQNITLKLDLPSDRLHTEQVDLSSIESITALASKVTANHPRLDALINSAGSYRLGISKDNLVELMEINVLGPALLTHLLLPNLRGNDARPNGRVVNVAAAVYGTTFASNTTVEDLTHISRQVDPVLNSTGSYFSVSKYMLIHHALELSKRETNVTAIAVNPGYSIQIPGIPQQFLRLKLPEWLKKQLPASIQHIHEACQTNFKGLA